MADIKIFISSVQSEFSRERRLLYDYIRQDALLGQFFYPFIFENVPAGDLTAPQAYLKEAADCDIYLGLCGVNYGYEDTDGISPTEREYDIATEHHAHRLVYVLRTEQSRHPKETAFISKVEKAVVRRSFGDYEELRTAVYSSLVRYLEQKEIVRKLPFDASAHPTATIDCLDKEKIMAFVRKAKSRRGLNVSESDSVEKILSCVNLLTEDGRVTNAALLLFSSAPQRFFRPSEVKCAQFFGTKVEKPIKSYQVYEGTLFEMIQSAVAFVMSRVDAYVGQRDEGVESPIRYEIPESAVTEAVVNAVAHRDYTSNASVQVMLFRDRLEVWNPGRLPYGMTVDKLRMLHSSDPTNPTIAHPLFLTGDIEHLGTGTTDMIAACEEAGLPAPEFHQEEDFRVIIWRRKSNNDAHESNNVEAKSNNARAESNNAGVKLTRKQKMVLEFCEDTPHTREEILNYVGVKLQTKTFKQYITKLIDFGLLRPLEGKSKSPAQSYISSAEK